MRLSSDRLNNPSWSLRKTKISFFYLFRRQVRQIDHLSNNNNNDDKIIVTLTQITYHKRRWAALREMKNSDAIKYKNVRCQIRPSVTEQLHFRQKAKTRQDADVRHNLQSEIACRTADRWHNSTATFKTFFFLAVFTWVEITEVNFCKFSSAL